MPQPLSYHGILMKNDVPLVYDIKPFCTRRQPTFLSHAIIPRSADKNPYLATTLLHTLHHLSHSLLSSETYKNAFLPILTSLSLPPSLSFFLFSKVQQHLSLLPSLVHFYHTYMSFFLSLFMYTIICFSLFLSILGSTMTYISFLHRYTSITPRCLFLYLSFIYTFLFLSLSLFLSLIGSIITSHSFKYS